ncbi:PAS/PAC sensor signal transduction histidine kinase [Thiogranum longum]|uniref:Phosphate regulon sensor protein PhoR n=1 Tax=Thiogranum longum TaxID=1537524 RepID=A0A4R1HPB7_9GAMM|nr:phosphate regulon sensor histidine kinase PhoR [Thiogranum longum]TCK19122.1 PAS/PAC sensor signal transduction histidine kinase [Thiogranum longum]
MTRAWQHELWRLAALILVGVLVGALAGQVMAGLLLVLVIYLGWHLYNLNRLVRWLRESKSFKPPEASGIWDEAFEHIYRLQQRNQKRKRNLSHMLKRLHKMTGALPDATVELRPDSEEIEWWNTAAARYLGFEFPRDSGQRISNLIRHPAFLDYLHSDNYEGGVEIPSPVNEGQTLRIRLVRYAGNRRLLVARDMTHIQKLERMRQDFVANVSHELRTPLTVITGYLEAMIDDEPDERCVVPLQSMQEQSERMRRLVEDLMLLARLESDEPNDAARVVDIPELVAQVVSQAKTLSGVEGHRFEVHIENTLCLVGVKSELFSAFSNLVFNAVRYTPAGGSIQVDWVRENETGLFSVTDSGPGIEAQHIPRLTERFYRVDAGRSRARGGTGLGLAIVKHVLLRHQGRLEIDSEPGRGSRFGCRFPESQLRSCKSAKAL